MTAAAAGRRRPAVVRPSPALATAAVLAGGLAALGPALFLASAPPGLAAATGRGVCGGGLALGPVLLLASAWRAAAERELGTAQVRWAAGERWAGQAGRRARTLARTLVPATGLAAVGGVAGAAAAGARAGSLAAGGGPWPGPAFVAGAVVAPILGLAVGAVAGLAVTARRQVVGAGVTALVTTVGVLLLRPYVGAADTLSPYTPFGPMWPITSGWSLSRWFALDLGLVGRGAGAVPWLALLVTLAARSWRAGPCLRSSAAADHP